MNVITKKELLQSAKEFLSAELNRVQDKINKLEKETTKVVLIPNKDILEIEKIVDASAHDIAIVIACYELRGLPKAPTIIGTKFGDTEYVKVHYNEN